MWKPGFDHSRLELLDVGDLGRTSVPSPGGGSSGSATGGSGDGALACYYCGALLWPGEAKPVPKTHKCGPLGQLKLSTRSAASAGAECAGFSAPAPCTRPAAGTAPSRPTADRPAAPAQACDRRRSKATAGCGLLPCPVTRCALALSLIHIRRSRRIDTAASRPAPPRLPTS